MKVLVALKHLSPEAENTPPASPPETTPVKRRSGNDTDAKAEDTHVS